MNGENVFFAPRSASTFADHYDVLFYAFVGVSAVVILGIFLTGLFFSIRYHRSSTASRQRAPMRARRATQRAIEYAWYAIPLVLFVAGFYWGAQLYAQLFSPPANALEIYVVAKQWMWKLQHPTGQREIDELHVPRGVPVRLVMTSQDVIHSFYAPAFRLKRDVVPGVYLTTWFQADKIGQYWLLCAEYCGTHHSHMRARIIVMDPVDYQKWLSARPASASLAEQGSVAFRKFGCSGCHTPNSAVHAPDLVGLFGRPVPLSDGRFVTADETYIRDSILLPRKQIVAGFKPIMPSFEGQITEDDIVKIIAYIKSLGRVQGESAS